MATKKAKAAHYAMISDKVAPCEPLTSRQFYFFCIITLLVLWYSARWLFVPDMFFSQDEIILNYWTKIVGFPLFHLFTQKHDDRPVGWFFIAIMQAISKDNYYLQIASLILLHIINASLVYIFTRNYYKSSFWGLCCAIFFVCYFPACSATYYIGAIFDIACCTFVLLTLICFQNSREKFQYKILSVLFFYISLRSKEMSLLLPLIISLLVFNKTRNSDNITALGNSIKLTWPYYLISLSLIMAYLKASLLGATVPITHPYYMDFSINRFFININHYLKILMKINSGFWPSIIFGIILFLSIITKRKKMIFASLSFLLTMLPVLFYLHHSSELFLYIPQIFFSLIIIELLNICCLFYLKLSKNTSISKWQESMIIILLIFVTFASTNQSDKYRNYVENQQEIRIPLGRLYKYLKANITNVQEGTNFYLSGIPKINANQNNSNWRIIDSFLGFTFDTQVFTAYTDNIYPNLHERYNKDKKPKVFLQYRNGFFTKL